MKNFFKTPNKESNYQSYMVFVLTIIWTAVTSLVVSIGFLYFPELWLRWIILLGIAIIIAITNLALNNFGKTHLASWTLPVMLWLYITIPCYSAGGIFAPGILSQMSVIITAGFLIGRKGGLAFGLLTIIADLGLAYLEVIGRLPEPQVVHDPISRWISSIIPFVTILVLQYYAINHLRNNLVSMQREMIKRRKAEAVREKTYRELLAREKELQDYKYALDISSIVAILNTEGQFLYVNNNFCTISGYSEAELIGKTPEILLHRDQPFEYLEVLSNAMKDGKSHSEEFCNSAKDGNLFWVNTTIIPFLDEQRNIYQYMSISNDITPNKQMLEQLMVNKQRYKSIIEVASTGAWEYHLKTKETWFSVQYFEMLGIHSQEGISEATKPIFWTEKLHPEDRPNATKTFNDFLNGDPTSFYENYFRMRHQNGDWVWIWSRARRLLDNDGKVTDIILGTHTDISTRVVAEEKIKENEQLIKKITSQVPGNTYMFEIDQTGKPNILFVNRGNEEFNFTSDLQEVSDNSDTILTNWHEDDKSLFRQKMKEAYYSEKAISFQYRIVVNDITRWRWLQAIPEKGKTGKTIWYGATRDVTALVDYIASVEQTLYDISHVLRRPIASMLGITTLLSQPGLEKEECLDLVKQIHPIAQELDRFMIELNQLYEQKRQINSLNIDFSLLVDKRNSLFPTS